VATKLFGLSPQEERKDYNECGHTEHVCPWWL